MGLKKEESGAMKGKFQINQLEKLAFNSKELDKMEEAGVCCLECKLDIAKYYDRSKLTSEENEKLGQELSSIWVEQVIKPYIESVYKFAKEYGFHPVSQEINSYQAKNYELWMLQKSLGIGIK